jgi:hypothetical protein
MTYPDAVYLGEGGEITTRFPSENAPADLRSSSSPAS